MIILDYLSESSLEKWKREQKSQTTNCHDEGEILDDAALLSLKMENEVMS